jgi:hypothetical protein
MPNALLVFLKTFKNLESGDTDRTKAPEILPFVDI